MHSRSVETAEVPAGRHESRNARESESYPEVDVSEVPAHLRESVKCGAVRLALRIGFTVFSNDQWQFLLSLLSVSAASDHPVLAGSRSPPDV